MVVSKPYAKAIEPVRRQWSGSEKRVVEGIGIVKGLAFRTVLIDAWYASMSVMKETLEAISKVYYAPLKCNRLVSRSAASDYQRVETLTWTSAEADQGHLGHIKKFPKGHQVKVFRLAFASGRTEYIATNSCE